MRKPTLSVITANYNFARYIDDALDAVLSQSFRPLEVIVVDDGSTDNSVEVIEKIAKRDSSVRLLRNERNMGVNFTITRGLQQASGDFVYWASPDDRVLAGFFDKSLAQLAEHPRAGLCCSDPAWFDDSTELVRENALRWSNNPCYYSPDDLVRHPRGHIHGHTTVVKRSAFLGAGGFMSELKWLCDCFAHQVIGFRQGICYIPEPLAAIRVIPTSYSAAGARQWPAQRKVLNHMLYLLKSPTYLDVSPLFERSGVLATFGLRILRVILSNPNHRDYLSPALIRRALWNEFANAAHQNAARIAPEPVKRLYRNMRYGPHANRTMDEWSQGRKGS